LVRDTLQVQLKSGDDAAGQADIARLARLIQQGRYRGRSVALVLSPPTALFHALRVPPNILGHSPQQVQEALAWEIAREIRAEGSDLEVRYWPLPPGHAEGLNVMATALSARDAHRWVAAFAQHGLYLERIDVSPCALAQAAAWSWTPGATDAWVIVDIGATRTVLTVMVGDTPVYVRPSTLGASQWTNRISRFFDVSFEEAEVLKCNSGIHPVARGVRTGSGRLQDIDDIAGVLYGVLRESIDGLVRDITLCLSYAQGSYPDSHACRIFLAGGGAQLGGLCDYIAAHVDLPVQRILAPDDSTATRPSASFELPVASASAIGSAALELRAS
jgi:Tfp pilus assembly PilM family ATPase